jgi:hypothetical protein
VLTEVRDSTDTADTAVAASDPCAGSSPAPPASLTLSRWASSNGYRNTRCIAVVIGHPVPGAAFAPTSTIAV